MIKYNFNLISSLFIAILLMSSCNDNEIPEEDDGQKQVEKKVIDPNRAFNTTFDGKLFSVPSPIQTALLIQSTNMEYDEELLNDQDKASNYISTTSQALNLGIYGADLSYATLYNKFALALNYLNAIENLSNRLGIAGAFDANFLTRFEENSNNQDSMLVILSDAFRNGDNFLKENDRKSTSALILTGGWIESMYFAVNLYEKSNNKAILNRIGEQKQSLETIIDILTTYNQEEENSELIVQLEELNTFFDQIDSQYEYVEPKTDAENKLTTIKSKLIINISDELKNQIRDKINDIRGNIVS